MRTAERDSGWPAEPAAGSDAAKADSLRAGAKASAVQSQRTNEEGRAHSPWVSALVVAVIAIFVLGMPWFLVRAAHRSSEANLVADPIGEAEHVAGAKTYARSCSSCHQPRGEGKPGRYPSLIDSPWLVEDKETPIRIVLLGIEGPIEAHGQVYDGVMPNMGITLSDRDIAQVLTYVRSSFGNDAEPITEEEVAKVRASLGGRTKPWQGGAELIEARKTPVLSQAP